MYSGTYEETMCTNCLHREVCSLSNDFLKAQKKVDDVSITLGHHENQVTFKYLRDFDWIKRVKLECTHFIQKEKPLLTLRDIE